MLQKWNKKIVVSLLAFVMVIAGCVAVISSGMSAKASDATEANEVADGMLDVKMQVKENLDGTVNMRLVSSVNGLGYYRVGFEVYYDVDGSGTIEDGEGYISLQTDKVLKRINATNTGVTYNYSPKVVDTDAEYFITYTLTNIGETLQGRDFYIRSYVIPLDSKTTKEYGTGRYFNINDATNNAIINIPVEVAENALTVGSTANVTVATVASTATVEAYKDGYAHLNVKVPANATVTTTKSANKTLLASANKIEVKSSDDSSVLGSAIYRNLDSTYKNKNAGDNSWYTVDTSADAFVIATDADLYGLTLAGIDANGAPKTVYLVSDITLNSGTVDSWEKNGFAGLTQWKPASIWGTFDGQGHTISGLYLSTASQNAGMFGNVKCNAIKNFSLKNSYLESTFTPDAIIGSIAGTFGGNMVNVYSDAKVVTTKGFKAGGLVGYGAHQKSSMSGCCFAGTLVVNNQSSYQPYTGGFIGQAAQPLTLTNCLFTGNVDATWTRATASSTVAFYVGGLAGYCSSTINVDNCLSNGTIYALWNTQTQATPTTMTGVASLIGGAQNTVTISNVYDFNDVKQQTDGGIASNVSATTITDAYYDKNNNKMVSLDTTVLRLPEASLLGLDGCRYLALDFEETWAAVEGGLPRLKAFAENPMDLNGVTSIVSYEWYGNGAGTEASPYVLNNAKDLYGFSFLSNISTYSAINNKVVKLAPNTEFVMNQGTVAQWKENNFTGLNNWIPIKGFAGLFDGQGATISGLYLDKNTTKVGMFNDTQKGSVICNFSLKNSYIYNENTLDARVGSIIGNAQGGTLENVYSDAVVKIGNGIRGGGLIGFTETDTFIINRCWFNGDVVLNNANTYRPNVGGFVGQASKAIELKDCLFTGTVNATWEFAANNSTAKQVYVGGFVGMCSSTSTIEDCVCDGTVYAYWNTRTQATPTMTGVASLIGSAAGGVTASDVYDFNTVTQQTDGGETAGTAATSITYATYNNSYADTTGGAIALSSRVLHLNRNLLLGADGCRYTTLDFENTWAAVDGALPQLKYFAEKPMDLTGVTNLVDYTWYYEKDGAQATPYVLSDSKDLYGFSIISTIDPFKNKYIQLATDTTFTLNNGTVAEWETNGFEGLNNWKPIVNFAGSFAGQGSTITGLYCETDVEQAGLFKNTQTSAVLSEFSLNNSYLVSSCEVVATIGSIVGNAGGTLNKISSDAKVVTTTGFKAGGLVGYGAAAITLTDCSFSGDVIVNHQELTYGLYAGGLVGQTAYALTMSGCSFTGNVLATYTRTNADLTAYNFYVGGLAGRTANADVTITDTTNNGTVSVFWKGAKTPATFIYVDTLIGKIDKTPTTLEVTGESAVTKQVLQ